MQHCASSWVDAVALYQSVYLYLSGTGQCSVEMSGWIELVLGVEVIAAYPTLCCTESQFSTKLRVHHSGTVHYSTSGFIRDGVRRPFYTVQMDARGRLEAVLHRPDGRAVCVCVCVCVWLVTAVCLCL